CYEHGFRGVPALIRGDDHLIVFTNQFTHLLFEPNIGAELASLLDQRRRQVASENACEAADIVDVLFGVERRELTTELGKRIDDARRNAAETGVEGGKKPRGPTANDRYVSQFCVAHTYARYRENRSRMRCLESEVR